MAIFKCKMCGGNIDFTEGATVGVCDSCGTKQTLPRLDDEKRANLYDRANHFRRNNEYDKAMSIYEKILEEDNQDAEAYWSIILCKYGIEYVEDPKSHKRVPTVNRAQFGSVISDKDYKSALKYCDNSQKAIYQAEAKAIDNIQKGILEISAKEEPFDIFICYKETDNSGRRTPDSVLATELYHELTKEGFKVFFSRITLEDKLGTAYEPYIFAALNSAKVMVVLGTKPEYFNAVWVKNEWSRYLGLIKSGEKKVLIPAYRDMDPYDLPEEFSHLQAQDMSKLGFMQDLTRGINKIVSVEAPKQTVKETVVMQNENGNVQALLDRGFMALEDGEWAKADGFFEQALNFDAKIARAYLGKLMAELRVKKEEDLKNCDKPFDSNNNYVKACRFDKKLAEKLAEDNKIINERVENIRFEDIYNSAITQMQIGTIYSLEEAIKLFLSIADWKNSNSRIHECEQKLAVLKESNKQKALSMSSLPFKKQLTFDTNTIWFGNYNGLIEWIVLKKENNKALLISKYALDCQPYNTSCNTATWESSSIRKWMNSTFLNSAFSTEEQEKIKITKVFANKNSKYITHHLSITKDKIFLLNVSETQEYFTSDEKRKCVPTKYAIMQGACTSDIYKREGVPTCWWWLRTSGYTKCEATCIDDNGSIDRYGSSVYGDDICVRPAMWISVE